MNQIKETMKVSVIIPTYNRRYVLKDAIESVIAQTYTQWELIIVDDGSTDDTYDMVKPYMVDERISFVRQDNAGVAAARNTGIAHATGDFIAFLDSDDAWMREKLEVEIQVFVKHPEVGMVFSDVQTEKDGVTVPSYIPSMPLFSSVLDKSLDIKIFPSRIIFNMLLQEYPTIPSATIVRKKLIDQNGMFKIMNAEDWEFSLRMSMAADVAYINKPLAVRRIQGDSLNSTKKPYLILDMLSVLRSYRRSCTGVQKMAAKMGQHSLYKLLGWVYLQQDKSVRAVSAYVHGAFETASLELIFRAINVFFPNRFVQLGRYIKYLYLSYLNKET